MSSIVTLFEVIRRIKEECVEVDDGYIVRQLERDVAELGERRARHFVLHFSPSKLGKLGFLGLRKLAKIRRDNPSLWALLVAKEVSE